MYGSAQGGVGAGAGCSRRRQQGGDSGSGGGGGGGRQQRRKRRDSNDQHHVDSTGRRAGQRATGARLQGSDLARCTPSCLQTAETASTLTRECYDAPGAAVDAMSMQHCAPPPLAPLCCPSILLALLAPSSMPVVKKDWCMMQIRCITAREATSAQRVLQGAGPSPLVSAAAARSDSRRRHCAHQGRQCARLCPALQKVAASQPQQCIRPVTAPQGCKRPAS